MLVCFVYDWMFGGDGKFYGFYCCGEFYVGVDGCFLVMCYLIGVLMCEFGGIVVFVNVLRFGCCILFCVGCFGDVLFVVGDC